MAQVAETEFVTARAEAAKVTNGANSEEITPDDFHRWLDLARLIAASYGAAEVTTEHWAAAMTMENARVARAKAATPPSPPSPAGAPRPPKSVSPSTVCEPPKHDAMEE